jgi:beta-lactam-binding protein with PASTA domain
MLGDSIRRRRPVRSRPDAKGRKGRAAPAGRDPDGAPRRGPNAGWLFGGWLGGSPAWLRWLVAAALVLVISFFGGYILATVFVFPPPATAGAGVPVPSLYGLDRNAAEQRLREVGLGVGTVTELATGRAGEGRVIAQEPIPDQQLRPGASVALAVSAGSPTVRVPPVTGLRGATARDLLEAAGFEVAMQTVRAPGPVEAVLRTDPAAGTAVRLPASITVVVNLGPEEPEDPEEGAEWEEGRPADAPGRDPVEPVWP